MRIHHINCGSMCPYGGYLWDGRTPGLGASRLSCHCLLVEAPDGLVLVDTGTGTFDQRRARRRLSEAFVALDHISFEPHDTAIGQIRALGFAPEDVRHVVLTHLDFDHAGGLPDFPHAAVHLLGRELDSAEDRTTPRQRGRYRPQQWAASTGPLHLYSPQGEAWFGFPAVHGLHGLPPEFLMIPLPGHTLGQCGIAIRGDDGWLLHAGDAYFYRGEMDFSNPHCTPGLRFYQWFMEMDRQKRFENQHRLRALVRDHGGEIDVFCSHDAVELERRRV